MHSNSAVQTIIRKHNRSICMFPICHCRDLWSCKNKRKGPVLIRNPLSFFTAFFSHFRSAKLMWLLWRAVANLEFRSSLVLNLLRQKSTSIRKRTTRTTTNYKAKFARSSEKTSALSIWHGKVNFSYQPLGFLHSIICVLTHRNSAMFCCRFGRRLDLRGEWR